MGIQLASQFGAMTATIQFGGREIGQLQNVAWDENSNIVRVKALGSAIDIAHLPGATEYTITASRALLDGNVMTTLMQSAIPYDALDSTTKGYINDSTKTISADQIYALLTSSNASYVNNQKIVGLTFDIVITDIDSKTAFSFSECMIQSKKHRLDVNGIIVMQDVTMLSRRKIMLTNTVTTSPIIAKV